MSVSTPSAADAALAPSQTSTAFASAPSQSSTFVPPPPLSTYTPPTSSATPSGDNNNNSSSSLGSSASLYLYTFLATLVLLLGVSSAIVLRSIVIRRRQRRLMEEAIRNGTWVPPAPSRKIDPNDKPVLYQVYAALDESGKARGIGGGRTDTEEAVGGVGESWEGFYPFFGAYANPSNSPSASASSDPEPGTASSPRTGWRARLRLPTLFPARGVVPRSRRTRRQPDSSGPNTPPSSTPRRTTSFPLVDLPPREPGGQDPTPASLRYAVLVAMPSVSRSKANAASGDEPGELPHLEFGVADGEVREANGMSGAAEDGIGETKGKAAGV